MNNSILIRILDILLSLGGIIITFPAMIVIYILCLKDTGSPVFKQVRIGQHSTPFTLYKFRTMSLGTKSVGTHEVDATSVTKLGCKLRRTKLDELPQLFNVLKGEMGIVGPRPCLDNQNQLLHERKKLRIMEQKPGITGLAQVKGIDMSQPKKLAFYDYEMAKKMNFCFYLYLIFSTIRGKGQGDNLRP